MKKLIHLTFILLTSFNLIGQEISIEEARAIDADGVILKDGESATVTGVMSTINFRPDGLQCTIIDAMGFGLGVFLGSNDSNIEYKTGDELKITGTLSQFNGLAQVSGDVIEVLSSGNSLVSPVVVTTLGEETESTLIMFENVSLADPTQWGDGASFNVDITDGSNTFAMRIDSDTEIAADPAPEGNFNVVGIGGQFDNSSPFLSGYQILPGTWDDFEILSSTENTLEDLQISVSPNPVQNILNIKTERNDLEKYTIYTLTGKKVSEGMYTNQIDVNLLPSGSYLLQLNASKENQTLKFIKE